MVQTSVTVLPKKSEQDFSAIRNSQPPYLSPTVYLGVSDPRPTAPAPAPAPTPQPAQINTQTASVDPNAAYRDQLANIKTESLRIRDLIGDGGDTTMGDFNSSATYEDPWRPEPFDYDAEQRKATRNQLRLFQAEIDATNKVYDQLLNEARLEGKGRLGSQRAVAARGGLLGSDFAGAQKDRVLDYNTDINRGIQAERTAAIGAIMGNVRQAAVAELAERRAARQAGAEEYINYLSQKSERKQNYINTLVTDMLTQGIDISQFSEQELDEFGREAGFSAKDIIATYKRSKQEQDDAASVADLEGRKTEAEIAKIESDIERGKIREIGEGTMLYNTETRETFKNPKTYKPDGVSGLSINGQALSQDNIADVHSLLQETRGGDGYADTGEYLAQLEGFVNLGGDPKDFIKEFDPDIYINPNDPSRSFLQSQMKKQNTDVFLGALGGINFDAAIAEASAQ